MYLSIKIYSLHFLSVVPGKEKCAEVRYFIKKEHLPKPALRKLTLKDKECPQNEVFLSTDKRNTNIIDITKIVGKCQVKLLFST